MFSNALFPSCATNNNVQYRQKQSVCKSGYNRLCVVQSNIFAALSITETSTSTGNMSQRKTSPFFKEILMSVNICFHNIASNVRMMNWKHGTFVKMFDLFQPELQEKKMWKQ